MEFAFFLNDETVSLILGNLRSLARLIVNMGIGLFIANALEAFHWTRIMQKISNPVARLAHLQPVTGVAFSLAFASPAAANAMLSDAYTQHTINKKELIFANILNSTPTFLMHLPSITLLLFAFIGKAAFIYMGFTLAAALLRTSLTMVIGHFTLPLTQAVLADPAEKQPLSAKQMWLQTWKRTKKRLKKLVTYTVPCYLVISLMQYFGCFAVVEQWMLSLGAHTSFIHPEAYGIIALSVMAETGIAFSAAAALTDAGSISQSEIIIALLIGNIISSPIRSIRHQFPSYAGYYSPSIALLLVGVGQSVRALSLLFVTSLYIWYVLAG